MFFDADSIRPISAYREQSDGKVRATDGMYLISKEEASVAIRLLTEYIDTFSDDEIKRENDVRDYDMHHPVFTGEKPKKKVYKDGYVYLLYCAGKYKIGFSNNVERRVKQLDTRPFPLYCVAKIYSTMAYQVEQEVHRMLEPYKVDGEWYEFDDFLFNIRCFYRFVDVAEATINEEKGEY